VNRLRTLALAGSLAFGLVLSVRAAESREPANVIAIQVAGSVSVAHGKGATPVPLTDNEQLAAGDIVETAPQSSVVLVLPSGSTVSLKEKSRIAITLVLQSPFAAPDLVVYDHTKPEPSTSSTSLELVFGELVAKVRKLLPGSDFSIKTAAGQSGVKGTEFELAYSEDAAGEASYRLSTASGLVVYAPVEGAPVETAAGRQIEVRGRRGKAGLKMSPVQARPLPAETRARIQKQNQVAVPDATRALQRAKIRRDASPTRPAERVTKPNEPVIPKSPAAKRPASQSPDNTPPESPPKKKKPAPPVKRGG
jgi:hypothetical protein